MGVTGLAMSSSVLMGRLEGVSVPDLLWALSRGRRTGVLQLARNGITKSIFLQEGRIVFAASTDPNDRLGEMLLRDGSIRLDHLEAGIERLGTGKRLGTLLVESGHLSPQALVRAVVSQVRSVVLGLFVWDEGEYHFKEGSLPTEEVITLGMRTGEILLQGIGRVRSFARVRRSVGSPRTRYRLTEWPGCELAGLPLSEGTVLLLQRLESGPQTVEDLCREVFLSNFEIYQALWAFKVLGAIEEVEGKPDGAGASLEGRLCMPHGLAGLLVRLCREGETGVLHVARGAHERAFHLKEGCCVFATSNDPDDGLVAHLLRRGVISLRDREEVVKRLLSNKRVGAILLEMGALEPSELREVVREQLGEIVLETIGWQEGEFFFVAGELPTLEDIVIEDSLEDLIARGLRRIAAWSRVREGCGGIEARFGLSREYLSVLDRMEVGPEDWEVVAALQSPRTVGQVCRQTQLGDFRTCQVLWTLLLLGAIEPADAARSAEPEKTADSSEAAWSLGTPEVVETWREASGTERDETPAPATDDSGSGSESDVPTPLPVVEPFEGEVISDLWRLAAETAPQPAADPQGAAEPQLALLDPPTPDPDATVHLWRDEVEAALRTDGVEDEGPHFEMDVPPAPDPEPARNREPAALDGPADHDDGEADLPPDLDTWRWGPRGDESVPSDWPEAESAWSGLIDAEQEDFSKTDDAEKWRVEGDAGALPSEAPPVATLEAVSVQVPIVTLQGGFEASIARFNARQKLLYHSIRAEVGAGAANFVRSCRAGLGEGPADLFEGAELNPDGSWDVEALRRRSGQLSTEEPSVAFERLLEAQIDRLTLHVGEARARVLRERLRKI